MLILLPPSEAKSTDGDGPALDLASLSFPELTPVRAQLVEALVALSDDPAQASAVLGLGPKQGDEVRRNAELATAPTQFAQRRYTGVLYDALDVGSLRAPARARASERLIICSALFGLVSADDPIPAYRLSGGSRLPRLGSLPSLWKPLLAPLLASLSSQQLVIDLRSGTYRALAPVPGAVTVRVLTEQPDGSRSIVSHFNKATKGLLARLLVRTSSDCTSQHDVARVARRGGLEVELAGTHQLDVIVRN